MYWIILPFFIYSLRYIRLTFMYVFNAEMLKQSWIQINSDFVHSLYNSNGKNQQQIIQQIIIMWIYVLLFACFSTMTTFSTLWVNMNLFSPADYRFYETQVVLLLNNHFILTTKITCCSIAKDIELHTLFGIIMENNWSLKL